MNFLGRAKPIEDVDLPRIGHEIGVGEDIIHALMDVEAPKSGFDPSGRPRILFEPARFYKNLTDLATVGQRQRAVQEGLAAPKWGQIPYGTEASQYGKLTRATNIHKIAALRSCSWGRSQIMGENHLMAGYASVELMIADFCDDEDNHIEAMIRFIKASKIDDDLKRIHDRKRRTVAADWVNVASTYNGSGYAKHNYHGRLSDRYNFWFGIRDTPWSPNDGLIAEAAAPTAVPIFGDHAPAETFVIPASSPQKPQETPVEPIEQIQTAAVAKAVVEPAPAPPLPIPVAPAPVPEPQKNDLWSRMSRFFYPNSNKG